MYPTSSTSGINGVQSTIASTTAANSADRDPLLVGSHHPITCQGPLYFDEEGEFSCEHAKAQRGESRTQACLNHSVAMLLIELASKL